MGARPPDARIYRARSIRRCTRPARTPAPRHRSTAPTTAASPSPRAAPPPPSPSTTPSAASMPSESAANGSAPSSAPSWGADRGVIPPRHRPPARPRCPNRPRHRRRRPAPLRAPSRWPRRHAHQDRPKPARRHTREHRSDHDRSVSRESRCVRRQHQHLAPRRRAARSGSGRRLPPSTSERRWARFIARWMPGAPPAVAQRQRTFVAGHPTAAAQPASAPGNARPRRVP